MSLQFRCAGMFVLGTLLSLLHAPSAQSATYIYQDTTFINSDWVDSLWADTSTPASSYTAGQVNLGGSTFGPNTPDYRETTHNYGPGAILVDHRNTFFNWNPGAGEYVTDLDFGYDLRHLTGDVAAGGIGGAVGYGLLIYQAGKLYRSEPQDTIFPDVWTQYSHTLVPLSSFHEIPSGSPFANPLSNPLSNLPMSFGYMSSNSANGQATKVSGIDNLKITLRTTRVPEPGTLVLALTGLGLGIVLRARCKV